MTELNLPLNKIVCGDSSEVLKSFPTESIDLLVTDPPYGISFMGKDWDKSLPPKTVFQECFKSVSECSSLER